MSTNTQIISEVLNAHPIPGIKVSQALIASIEKGLAKAMRERADAIAAGEPYDALQHLAQRCIEMGKRCQSQTSKGRQCKQKAGVYHQHTDGNGYLACSQHARDGFRPCREAQQT